MISSWDLCRALEHQYASIGCKKCLYPYVTRTHYKGSLSRSCRVGNACQLLLFICLGTMLLKHWNLKLFHAPARSTLCARLYLEIPFYQTKFFRNHQVQMNQDFDAIVQMSDSCLLSSCYKLLSVSCFMTMPFRTILVMCCRSSNAEVINLLCMKKCMSSCLLTHSAFLSISGTQVWFNNKCQPQLAGFKMEVVKTTHAGHAKSLVSTVDFSTCPDGICNFTSQMSVLNSPSDSFSPVFARYCMRGW